MGFLDLTGLDIVGEADARDARSLAEVAALAATDRLVSPTQETTELYSRLKQENTEASREFRFENQEELTRHTEDRIGVVMGEKEFFRRLGKLIPVEPHSWGRDGLRGFEVVKDNKRFYAGAVQQGYMPEFSLLDVNEHQVPTKEKLRGWRGTVLLRLILGGVITEEAAHREFGPPALNRASLIYRKKLYKYRNRKGE